MPRPMFLFVTSDVWWTGTDWKGSSSVSRYFPGTHHKTQLRNIIVPGSTGSTGWKKRKLQHISVRLDTDFGTFLDESGWISDGGTIVHCRLQVQNARKRNVTAYIRLFIFVPSVGTYISWRSTNFEAYIRDFSHYMLYTCNLISLVYKSKAVNQKKKWKMFLFATPLRCCAV
jgi:hypothetical protein